MARARVNSLILSVTLSVGVASSALGPALPAFAQAAGTIGGIVTDATGKPLAGAHVQLVGTGVSQATATDATGRFTFSVPPGTYDVTVSANGFIAAQNDDVVVAAGPPTNVAFSLEAATLQEIGRVVVSQNPLAINRNAAATQTMSGQAFVDQGQPQVKRGLDQIPGVEIQQFSSNAPGSNSSISVRGAQPYESQILIDGHPVVEAATGVFGFNTTFLSSLLLGGVEVSEGPGNLPNTIENAVGGTVNFKTPAITPGPAWNAIAGWDSWDSSYFGIRFSETFGKVGVLLGASQYWTPGYLPKGAVAYGGAVFPTVTAGTANTPRSGVIDFSYPASQNFLTASQLAKVSYSFSPVTSLVLSQFSTQTDNDESGTNDQLAEATIVPCITKTAATCPPTGTTNNFTASPFLGLVGSVQGINLFAPFASTSEFDNEPMYSAEFRTVIGPGSFLARYYTAALARILSQSFTPTFIPCVSPACPATSGTSESVTNEGAPFIEDEKDVLHGMDAQYSVPIGPNTVTLGFDRHVDSTFGDFEFDPASTATPPPVLAFQSLSYSARTDLQVTKNLKFQGGLYDSSTTYVGNRLDPRGGFVYTVDPDATVRVAAGSAFVAPYYSLITPFTPTPKAGGTLSLASTSFAPETSFGYDIGADVKSGTENLFSGDLYLTNIFNRYATVTLQTPGTFNGVPFTAVSQNGNQAIVRNMGAELTYTHAPRVGLGFRSSLDLLRDYAYNQTNVGTSNSSIFGTGTPGNYVQLPQYPYYKMRNDVFWTFASGVQARVSGESYGANNSYGQAGFTLFDAQVLVPLPHDLAFNIGGSNLGGYNNNQEIAIFDGGYTYRELSGGTGSTTQFFAQPRTIFLQLQAAIGKGASPISTIPGAQ